MRLKANLESKTPNVFKHNGLGVSTAGAAEEVQGA